MFSIGHFILIFITVALTFALIYNRDFIKQHKRQFEIIIIIILVLSRISRTLEYLRLEEYYRMVPFQLCSLGSYLTMIHFWKNNEKLRNFLFYSTFFGITAIVYPDISFRFDNVLVYGFSIDHIILLLTPLYFVLIDNYKPTFKNIKWPFIIITFMFILAWPVTSSFGGNYMYIQEKPLLSDIFPNANELAYIFSALGVILLGSLLNVSVSKYAYNNLTSYDN